MVWQRSWRYLKNKLETQKEIRGEGSVVALCIYSRNVFSFFPNKSISLLLNNYCQSLTIASASQLPNHAWLGPGAHLKLVLDNMAYTCMAAAYSQHSIWTFLSLVFPGFA